MGRPAVVRVVREKCVNCHACVAACPVKVCNDASGDFVNLKDDLCIGCGRCLTACTHQARVLVDDAADFLRDLTRGQPIVALVAPSATTNFPDRWLHLNGWLITQGVAAVFDIGFGAELAAKSYAEHLRHGDGSPLITQPCPVVVTYIQLYHPELLPLLAPIASPTAHMIEVIRRRHGEFHGHRLAIISPCPARRREMWETGAGDYHVTFASLAAEMATRGESLDAFQPRDYVLTAGEPGVRFPSPGGLLAAVALRFPEAHRRAEEIHGTREMTGYLSVLADRVLAGKPAAPLIDCLNCAGGCHAGPGSLMSCEDRDDIACRMEGRQAVRQNKPRDTDYRDAIDACWSGGEFGRSYRDLSLANTIRKPDELQRQAVFEAMHKRTPSDLQNCCACGYGSCEAMATAIFNGLNRPENCHHFLATERMRTNKELAEYRDHLEGLVQRRTGELLETNHRLHEEIAERNLAARAVRDSEQKLRDIMQGSPIPQFVIGIDHRVMYWNRAVEQLSGILAAEVLLTRDHWRAFYLQQRPCLADFLLDGEHEQIRIVYGAGCRPSLLLPEAYEVSGFFPAIGGVGKWLFGTAALVRDSEGTIVGAVETLEDITAMKSAEEGLSRAKQAAEVANLAKSEFLANMSHEIRTPMTAILGYTDILSEHAASPEAVDAIQTITRNGKHLLSLLNDILDLSKIEAGRMGVECIACSPLAIVAEVESLMRVRTEAKNLALSIHYDWPLPETIQTDPVRLRQILLNLVGNAIKFTETGSVRLSIRLAQSPGEDPKIVFQVRDTGIGIAADAIDTLFHPFAQADSSICRCHGGTGLGLTISKRLAEKLGGRIAVQSEPGKGSDFSLILQIGSLQGLRMVHSVQRTGENASAATRWSQFRPHTRILLAEDGPDNQRLIAFLLRKAGAEVCIAPNGQEAFDQAMACRASGSPFDMILMDMQMPVLDGYEATRRLRTAGYTDPIVALTAHAMSDDRQRCLAAGCDEYLTKPIDRATLLSTISRQMRPVPGSTNRSPLPAGECQRLV